MTAIPAIVMPALPKTGKGLVPEGRQLGPKASPDTDRIPHLIRLSREHDRRALAVFEEGK